MSVNCTSLRGMTKQSKTTQTFRQAQYDPCAVSLSLSKTWGCSILFIVLFPLFVTAQNKDSIALKYANSLSVESLKKNLTVN